MPHDTDKRDEQAAKDDRSGFLSLNGYIQSPISCPHCEKTFDLKFRFDGTEEIPSRATIMEAKDGPRR